MCFESAGFVEAITDELRRSFNFYPRQLTCDLIVLHEPSSLTEMVGVAGFEPAALRSQTECADQTALHPEKFLIDH